MATDTFSSLSGYSAHVPVPGAKQVDLRVVVNPTQTIYGFEQDSVKITVTFTTPAVVEDDLEYLSRSTTYTSSKLFQWLESSTDIL